MREQESGASAAGSWVGPSEDISPTWRAWLPAAFVLFSLFVLLAAPLVLNARISRIRAGAVTPGQEARGEVNDIRQAFSRGEAAIRGLLLTGEQRFLDRLREAQRDEREAFGRLLPLTWQLGPELAAEAAELDLRWRQVSEARDSLLQELREGGIPDQLLSREEERHELLLEESAALKAGIVEALAEARAEMRALERLGTLLTLLLALLALVSAVLVIRIGRGYRRRAVDEAKLRAAAFALTEATEVEEVLRRIAAIATHEGPEEHGYVERIDRESDMVEVVAAAGARSPAVGTRVPYPGSLTAAAVESGRHEIVPDVGTTDRPIAETLRAACRGCTALVLPLLAERSAEGALVIVRPRRYRFRERDILQKRALGVIAALALRKTVLLDEAQEQHEALQRLVDSRERLIRGFSHDVKNPLGAADGHAQLLAEEVLGDLSERQTESLERIRSGIGSAIELINDLIDLARAETGQLEIQSETVDIGALIEEAAEEYGAAADAAGLTLETELPPSLPRLRSDPQRVRQILSNLISNATKYTPPGGRIRLVAEPEPGRRSPGPEQWVAISVSDTGPGISAEERAGLFQEYQRLEPGTASGAGLGLAISDRIVRLLDGEITVESEPGVGSTFTIRLPVQPDGAERPG